MRAKLLTCLPLLLAAACATTPKPMGPPLSEAPETQMAPPGEAVAESASPSPSASAPPEVFGPSPPESRPILLVLGPGTAGVTESATAPLTRAFAHAGVIRALADAKIPVAGIIGAETGALIGALYAMDGSANAFEFRLLKIPGDLLKDGSFFATGPSDGARLADFLGGVFPSIEVPETKILFRPAAKRGPGEALLIDRGLLRLGLRAAMGGSPYIKALEGEGVTAALDGAELARLARTLSPRAPVVYVDLTGTPAPDAELVLRPDLAGIDLRDFRQKNAASYRGKAAVNANLDRIGELTRDPAKGVPQ